MDASFDLRDRVALVSGATGALGSAVCEAFDDAGATVCGTDLREPSGETPLDPGTVDFYEADFTDESDVREVVAAVVEEHGRLDYLLAVAGTWQGGSPVEGTDAETFDLLVDVNLKTAFLGAKHAIPHLRDAGGAMVAVSARSSLEGGEGDAVYRASKAGVRLLIESIAAENEGSLRANAVMPGVIDTPANREAMPDADHDAWTDPADVARSILALSTDAMPVTSGAAVPVYGES
ncbi:MAG: SDR family oxidoreductase [Halanaeroarchaeum sp.]